MNTPQTSSPKSTVGIKELAQFAGVSVGTVSRVLNDEESVSHKRRIAVEQAIKSLGYKRSTSAQLLASRRKKSIARTGNIALILTDMNLSWKGHPSFSQLIEGVDQACMNSFYHPLIETCQDDRILPRCVEEGKVDGILVKTSNHIPPFVNQIPDYVPWVLLGMSTPSLDCPQIMPDQRASGWTMTQHLLDHGHKRIAFISHEDNHRAFINRYQAFEELLRCHHLFDPKLVVLNRCDTAATKPQYQFPDMDYAVDQLWTSPSPPTAIVAANDLMAAGLYRSLRKRGLAVGKDVSIVGCDNIPSICEMIEPMLTSYEVPLTQTSRYATKILINLIDHPNDREPVTQLIPGKLIARQSVADLNKPQG
jgi:DNA-binding LacI/PurR family transcriptional regulator